MITPYQLADSMTDYYGDSVMRIEDATVTSDPAEMDSASMLVTVRPVADHRTLERFRVIIVRDEDPS